jgi:hypothetical protein
VFEFYLLITQQITESDFRRFSVILLETFYLIFRGITPEELIYSSIEASLQQQQQQQQQVSKKDFIYNKSVKFLKKLSNFDQ